MNIEARHCERWQATGYIEQLERHLSKHGLLVSYDSCSFDQANYSIMHFHAPYLQLVGQSKQKKILAFLRFFLWIWFFKLIKGGRVVWTAHDLTDQSGQSAWLVSIWNLVLAHASDRIFCHGKSAQLILLHQFKVRKEKVIVTPHPAYVGLFPRTVTREIARNQLGIPIDAFVYIMLGNIRPYKGARRFLQALDHTNQSENSLFIIAGSSRDQAELEFLKQESLRRKNLKLFPHAVESEDLQTYFAAADIAVFPYERITTSGAVLLAMSFGVPVLGSNINCLGEMIHPEGGIRYEQNQPDGLERALIAARQLDQASLREMGRYNLELASTMTWDDLADKTLQSYKELLKRA